MFCPRWGLLGFCVLGLMGDWKSRAHCLGCEEIGNLGHVIRWVLLSLGLGLVGWLCWILLGLGGRSGTSRCGGRRR